jgi:inward rectifier potassium channel
MADAKAKTGAEPRKAVRLRKHQDNMPKVEARGQSSRIHEDFYHEVLVWPWWRFFVFVSLSFLGVNALFALLYLSSPGSIANARQGSFEDAFFFSVQTLATIGYGVMSPGSRFGHVVVTLEALVGILGVALITGLAFAKFARPTARILFSEKAVVTRRDGVPHLMFRMANWRKNMVVEAQLRAFLRVEEVTREGESMRRIVDLPLVKDRSAMFILTWSAMHLIDEASPFHGDDALARLKARKAEIILSLSGVDETLGQNIHARYRYLLEDVVWQARFADVLRVDESGVRVIDYSRFHDVEPLQK